MPTGRQIGRLFAGSALGVVALWLTFRNVEVGLVLRALTEMRRPPVVSALLLVGATLVVLSYRWQLLVRPRRGSRAFPDLLAAVVTGQMINVILPIRLGEVVRARWISLSEREPFGRILSTIAIERLADIVTLGFSVTVLLTLASLPSWARQSAVAALTVSVAIALVAVSLGRWGDSALAKLSPEPDSPPGRVRAFLLRHSHTALVELRVLGDWRSGLKVGAASVAVVLLAVATNDVLFAAFDLPLGPLAALFLFVVLQIGVAPSSTPGNLGVFHFLTVLVLTAFKVERPTAIAYAVVLHAVVVGPKILAGSIVVAATKTPVFEWAGRRSPVERPAASSQGSL